MESSEIEEILNKNVFKQAKPLLLKSIADNPDRFVGLFRSTTPQLKLVQNLLQSREIRFGDAMEEVIALMLQEAGCENQPKNFVLEDDELSCDHYVFHTERSRYYLIEQKMRDDHDSTKKRGQFVNFQGKLQYLRSIHGELITGIMYFVDPSLTKNRNFYRDSMVSLRKTTNLELYLFYNGELFAYFGRIELWNTLLEVLRQWREQIAGSLELNFDEEPQETIQDLETIPIGTWLRLINIEALWTERLIQTIFPTGQTLQLLRSVFLQKSTAETIGRVERTRYKKALLQLELRLQQFYGI